MDKKIKAAKEKAAKEGGKGSAQVEANKSAPQVTGPAYRRR